MTRGVPITTDTRALLYRLYYSGNSLDQIHDIAFGGDTQKMSMASLRNILSKFKNSPTATDLYVAGPIPSRLGQPRKMSRDAFIAFRNFMNANGKRRRLLPAWTNAVAFIHLFYVEGDEGTPSVRTVVRALKLMRFSRKVITRVHLQANPVEQWDFLQRASFLQPDDIIDIDETPGGRTQFLQRFGYAPVGEACYKTQIIIGVKSYSIVAAYCTSGFLCWEIIEDGIDHIKFGQFILQKVMPLVGDKYVLLDNASIHKTPATRDILDYAFDGRYLFSAKYSPELKPIEKGFSNIKNWLRQREDQALLQPIQTINAAFTVYSVLGPRGDVARKHFNVYKRMHEMNFGILNNVN